MQLLAPVFDAEGKSRRRCTADASSGADLPAGPGAAAGRIAFNAEHAVRMAKDGPVILVRIETSPEDIAGMHSAAGILTTRGGLTSHAAVVARGMGRPCVVGAGSLRVDYGKGELRSEGHEPLEEGDWLSIDGSTGEIIGGKLADAALRGHPGAARRIDEAGAVGDLPQLRPPAEMGRRDPHARRPHERRHAERRARGAALRRAGHRPLPHRAHVLRRGAHPARARDDPRAQRGGTPQGARRAAAVPEGRLRRDLPRARTACR